MAPNPDLGLFIGMRGQGFMLGQYLAKMCVDKLLGNPVPAYFDRLTMKGDGLLEKTLSKITVRISIPDWAKSQVGDFCLIFSKFAIN